ncbi:MAG: hypothetical protein KC466_06770 [Myxococcales bacterium]|nr:hypothetical protein [Myxococcales bacterium]
MQAQIDKIRERVGQIDAEGERLIRSAIDRGRERLGHLGLTNGNGKAGAVPTVESVVHAVESRYEAGMSRVLGFFNIASTRDVEGLNKRISQLSRRVGTIGRAKGAKTTA